MRTSWNCSQQTLFPGGSQTLQPLLILKSQYFLLTFISWSFPISSGSEKPCSHVPVPHKQHRDNGICLFTSVLTEGHRSAARCDFRTVLLNLPGDLRKLPSSFCAVSFSPCHKTPPYLLGCWKAGPIPTRHLEDGKGAEVLFTGRPCSQHRPAARQSRQRARGSLALARAALLPCVCGRWEGG